MLKKKFNRKSIEFHKKRILARLNPKVDKGQTLTIVQIAGLAVKQSVVFIKISNTTQSTFEHLRKYPVQEHHRIVRALKYLVDEGKLESNISNKEWDVSLALGVAGEREFKLKGK